MSRSKTRTWIDYALWGVAAAIVVLFAYLGYSMWAQRNYAQATSPAGRAVANLEAIVRRSPNNVTRRIELAQAYAVAGRMDDAVHQYELALKLDKENPVALTGLGLIAMDAKQYKAGQGYFQRVVDKLDNGEYAQKDNRLEAAYYYVGLCLLEQKKEQEAVSYFKQALRIRRDASDSHYALSVAYKRLRLDDKAREELEYTLMFDPTMPEANYEAGQYLLQEGDVASAAERFRLALDKAPSHDEPRRALDKLGTVDQHLKEALSLQKSRPASATVEARIAVALDPNDPDAVRALAELYDAQKKKPEALSAYRKLLALVPDDKAAADAVKRLSKSGK